jgi:hypothetical protein
MFCCEVLGRDTREPPLVGLRIRKRARCGLFLVDSEALLPSQTRAQSSDAVRSRSFDSLWSLRMTDI